MPKISPEYWIIFIRAFLNLSFLEFNKESHACASVTTLASRPNANGPIRSSRTPYPTSQFVLPRRTVGSSVLHRRARLDTANKLPFKAATDLRWCPGSSAPCPLAEHDFQHVPERVRYRQNAAGRSEPPDPARLLSSMNDQVEKMSRSIRNRSFLPRS